MRQPRDWYWYVARENEIFLDLDSGRAITRALSVLRRALSVRPNAKSPINRLDVKSIWLYPSLEPKHAHLIIELNNPLGLMRRVAWALWMGGDQLRAAYVMERFAAQSDSYPFQGMEPAAELLAVRKPYGWRFHDDICECPTKHKAKRVTEKCPALRRILGSHRSDDYFPRNRDKVRRPPVRFAWGEIPLSKLKSWRSNAGR